jgi:hypothetical protein
MVGEVVFETGVADHLANYLELVLSDTLQEVPLPPSGVNSYDIKPLGHYFAQIDELRRINHDVSHLTTFSSYSSYEKLWLNVSRRLAQVEKTKNLLAMYRYAHTECVGYIGILEGLKNASPEIQAQREEFMAAIEQNVERSGASLARQRSNLRECVKQLNALHEEELRLARASNSFKSIDRKAKTFGNPIVQRYAKNPRDWMIVGAVLAISAVVLTGVVVAYFVVNRPERNNG